MHSRIFQLTTKPIKESEWLTENDDDILQTFPYSVAKPDGKRDDEIRWLLDVCPKCFIWIEDNTLDVLPNAKFDYFGGRFRELKKKVGNLHFEEFCDEYYARNLIELIEDKFGFHVYDDDGYVKTMDTFMRQVKVNTKLYIGGILDYHF